MSHIQYYQKLLRLFLFKVYGLYLFLSINEKELRKTMIPEAKFLITKEILKSIVGLTAAKDVDDFHFKFISTLSLWLKPESLAVY
ncbi:MAG: hypothetical protein ACI9IA_001185 [Enterobacterales bacterium]|jgi:hypothetical protein